MKRMPTAEPQPISDHFRPALFFVVRPHHSNSDCKAWAASYPAPRLQGSQGWSLAPEPQRAKYWLCWEGTSYLRAQRSGSPICAKKISSENKTFPVMFITEEGRCVNLVGVKIGETAPRQSDRPCRGVRLVWRGVQVRLNG